MKQVHVDAEWLALTTLACAENDAVRGLLLSSLTSGHFSYEVTHPLFVQISEIAAQTGAVPKFSILQAWPGVPSMALQSLGAYASQHRPYETEEEVSQLIKILDYYRKGRLVVAHANATLSEIEGEHPDMDKVKSSTEKLLLGLSDAADEAKLWNFGSESNSGELVHRVLSAEHVSGIKTGFGFFDDLSGGFRKGNFVALASHYKGGKSILALNMAINQARMGHKVLFIPLEMNDEETTERLLSCLSGVDSTKISRKLCSPVEIRTITRAFMDFETTMSRSGGKLSIHALSSATPSEISARYRAFHYDVIYLDYLKLMEPSSGTHGSNEAQRLDDIGKEVKRLAGAMQTVIVGLAQLDDKTEDLRYSKALKEHCNNVWTWVYKEAQRATGIIDVTQMAARSWEPKPFKLKVDYSITKVEDMPSDGASVTEDWNKDADMPQMFSGTGGW